MTSVGGENGKISGLDRQVESGENIGGNFWGKLDPAPRPCYVHEWTMFMFRERGGEMSVILVLAFGLLILLVSLIIEGSDSGIDLKHWEERK